MKLFVSILKNPRTTGLLLLYFMSAGTANAQLSLCNRTTVSIRSAVVSLSDGIWSAKGWWPIPAGQCVTVIPTRLQGQSVYIRGEETLGGRVWEGKGSQDGFCIGQTTFTIPATGAACTGTQILAKFFKIETKGLPSITDDFFCNDCSFQTRSTPVPHASVAVDKAAKADCDKYKDVKEKFDICITAWYQGYDYRIKSFVVHTKDPVDH